MSSPDRIDRRRFAVQMAAGTSLLTASVTPSAATVAAEGKPTTAKAGSEEKGADKQPDAEATAPKPPSAEVMLLSYLARRHPSEHFDDEALQAIFRDIRGDVARGQQLSEFPLTNADEPAFVFRA
jgi:hypothetical protein